MTKKTSSSHTRDHANISKQEFGLQVLFKSQASLEFNPTFTVILVHGYGGTATATWTHPLSSGFWPAWLNEDAVARSLSVRIATFGYDANLHRVRESKRDLSLRDFAQELLVCMEEYYKRYGDVFPHLWHSDWDRLQQSSLLIA